MGINGLSSASQGLGYNINVTNLNEEKVKQYDQMMTRLKQNLKRTEKDVEMPEEEKQKKQREIQMQIAELDRQKRQAETEASREKLSGNAEMAKGQIEGEDNQKEDPFKISTNPVDVQKEHDEKEEAKERMLTAGQMEAVVIGGNAVEHARKQQGTVEELENRIRVLGGEIDMDRIRETDTKAKEKEMEDLEERTAHARESTAERLGDERRKVEEKQEEAEEEIKQQQQNVNVQFIRSQKDVALPNFQVSI